MMFADYDPADWYWRVGAGTELYSSARRTYVSPEDADYLDWAKKPGNLATNITSETELKTVLAAQYPAGLPVDLAAYAASRRWMLETGGISLDGLAVETSRDSQALIHGAVTLAQMDSETVFRFKADTGFVSINAGQMIAIGQAVAGHVQACFSWEADVLDAIAAQTIASEADIDAAAASFAAQQTS